MGETKWADLRTHARLQGSYVHVLTALLRQPIQPLALRLMYMAEVQTRAALIPKSAGTNMAEPFLLGS